MSDFAQTAAVNRRRLRGQDGMIGGVRRMSLAQQDSLAMAMMRSAFATQRAVLGLMASPALLTFQITTVTMGLMEPTDQFGRRNAIGF
jgi:hypothetical protein